MQAEPAQERPHLAVELPRHAGVRERASEADEVVALAVVPQVRKAVPVVVEEVVRVPRVVRDQHRDAIRRLRRLHDQRHVADVARVAHHGHEIDAGLPVADRERNRRRRVAVRVPRDAHRRHEIRRLDPIHRRLRLGRGDVEDVHRQGRRVVRDRQLRRVAWFVRRLVERRVRREEAHDRALRVRRVTSKAPVLQEVPAPRERDQHDVGRRLDRRRRTPCDLLPAALHDAPHGPGRLRDALEVPLGRLRADRDVSGRGDVEANAHEVAVAVRVRAHGREHRPVARVRVIRQTDMNCT